MFYKYFVTRFITVFIMDGQFARPYENSRTLVLITIHIMDIGNALTNYFLVRGKITPPVMAPTTSAMPTTREKSPHR